MNLRIGPNGPIPEEILQLHPNATIIRRSGEVNAWDSEEFRQAVKATGKKQVILAGITTDVRPCLSQTFNRFLTLPEYRTGLHGVCCSFFER